MKILLLMFLGHLFADFTLQGWFANGKQEKWWCEQCADENFIEFRILWKKYGNDYKCALLEHGLYWSLVTFLPLFFLADVPDIMLAVVVVVNTLFHAWIDDLKTNQRKINLIQDQLFHFGQIVATWAAVVVWELI